ncbi:MAG: hypothetical protein DLM70_10565 [Chloroflexi bacterium]|nr:MAG: hypothetical protein DLM70_10565 [Chloroflexota bacterium]
MQPVSTDKPAMGSPAGPSFTALGQAAPLSSASIPGTGIRSSSTMLGRRWISMLILRRSQRTASRVRCSDDVSNTFFRRTTRPCVGHFTPSGRTSGGSPEPLPERSLPGRSRGTQAVGRASLWKGSGRSTAATARLPSRRPRSISYKCRTASSGSCVEEPWRDLPEEYEPWQTCSTRFHRWVKAGVYSGGRVRRYLRRRGIRAVIPRKHRVRRTRFHEAAYRKRNIVERLLNRLKHFRRIATRYEKRVVYNLMMVTPAAITLWV